MNPVLKRQIILQIFSRFGVFDRSYSKDTLLSDRYLANTKLVFEVDNKKYENSVWAGQSETHGSIIQFMIGDLTDDQIEFCLLIQLDNLPPYLIRQSTDKEDEGSFFFKVEEHWIEANTETQSRVLTAVEALFSAGTNWQPSKNVENLNKTLKEFLKFEATS